MQDRSLYKSVWERLSADKALILLAGPRQSGKTTFARDIAARDFADTIYFNWDIAKDKARLIADPAFFAKEARRAASARPLVILDEMHKYRDWKNYLKGVYDEFADRYQFLVTGSGRLEYSRKAGDSLAGRFLKFRLFPLTLAELAGGRRTLKDFLRDPLRTGDDPGAEAFENLWELSGFPEPFTKGRKTFWEAWSGTYGEQIVRSDLNSVADIRNLDVLETLYALLPTKVGGPLSINALARDLQVSFDTIKSWLALFDAFYLSFRIGPWTKRIARSILKEKKLYLFNIPVIGEAAARFENLVAVELLRAVETWSDLGLGRFSLHYLRTKEKTEVDFLIAEGTHPRLMIETKLADERPSPSLLALQNVLNVPAVQLVKKSSVLKHYRNGKNNVLVVTARHWLPSLP